MSHADLFTPLKLAHGPQMPNRFMLAPLTNLQSHPDGKLSDEEFHWLTLRAKGGFGVTMTCAAYVQQVGHGFPGQLGVWSDDHLEGLTRLATAIKAEGSVSSMQLHHAGNRSPKDLVGTPVSASDDPATGARGLSTAEVEQLVEDFVAAAVRAEQAGFEGVEIHGAHGYVLAQFLSPEVNRREDRYGGDAENRARIVWEIVEGVRSRCAPDFQLGLRLSPERFGLLLPEIVELARRVLVDPRIDYLDMSLWDVFKEPADEEFKGRSLASYFTELPRGTCKLGAAGKITSAAIAGQVIDMGFDFPLIGRAAILHHDFPRRCIDPAFVQTPPPVSAEYMAREGISPRFVSYLRDTFKMVEPEPA